MSVLPLFLLLILPLTPKLGHSSIPRRAAADHLFPFFSFSDMLIGLALISFSVARKLMTRRVVEEKSFLSWFDTIQVM
jgi:hypothetical protein